MSYHSPIKCVGDVESEVALVLFRVVSQTSWGDTVSVCGSVTEIGNWDPANASKLCCTVKSYPEWSGAILLPVSCTLEYKFLIVQADGSYRWEESIENRVVHVPPGGCDVQLCEFNSLTQSYSPIKFPVSKQWEHSVRAMTWNLRYDNPRDGRRSWQYRSKGVIDIMRETCPDVVGTQECLRHQLADIQSALPQYEHVGVDRRGGYEDEYSAIFYDTRKWILIETNTLALSETPDVLGSVSWNSSFPRIITIAALFPRSCVGTMLVVANTHLDHGSAEARRCSAALLKQCVHELKFRFPAALILLLGDFNSGKGGDVWNILVNDPRISSSAVTFRDAWVDAIAKNDNGCKVSTFHDFHGPRWDWRSSWLGKQMVNFDHSGGGGGGGGGGIDGASHIDWILYMTTTGDYVDRVRCVEASILTHIPDSIKCLPSDHYPIVCDFVVDCAS